MDVLEVCHMVARSLVAEIGPWGNHCAFIGGLVPGFLIPEPGEGLATHVGTRDVDLALRVAAIGEDIEMYRTLKNNLAALKLEQSPASSFAWTRTIDGFEVIVELFVPVENTEQAGKIQRKPIEKSGSGLTALGVYGLDLIERDIVEVEDEGPLLDDKGIKKVTLRVCGPAVLLGLKAWALHERVKAKDGYDVVWMLKAFGPEAVAARFRAAGLHETDFGMGALKFLDEHFSSPEHTGPKGWASESQFSGEEQAREVREAAGIVKDFLHRVQDTTRLGGAKGT